MSWRQSTTQPAATSGAAPEGEAGLRGVSFCPQCGAKLTGNTAVVPTISIEGGGYDVYCDACKWSGDIEPDEEMHDEAAIPAPAAEPCPHPYNAMTWNPDTQIASCGVCDATDERWQLRFENAMTVTAQAATITALEADKMLMKESVDHNWLKVQKQRGTIKALRGLIAKAKPHLEESLDNVCGEFHVHSGNYRDCDESWEGYAPIAELFAAALTGSDGA